MTSPTRKTRRTCLITPNLFTCCLFQFQLSLKSSVHHFVCFNELVFNVLLLLPSHQRTYNIKSTMPPEIISEPNPQALPSHLPDYLEKLSVELDHKNLDGKTCDALLKFRRAACYIAAGKRDYMINIYIYQNSATNLNASYDISPRKYSFEVRTHISTR